MNYHKDLLASFAGTRKLTERSVMTDLVYSLEQGLGTAWFDPITFATTSDQPDGENHGWLGGVQQMAERKGDPKFGKLRAATFAIKNKPFQAGVLIPKEDWLFDRKGQIQKRVMDQVDVALGHPGLLLMDLIEGGATGTCYDGSYYFTTTHSEGASGTQTNALTHSKAGSAIAAVDVKNAVLKCLEAIWNFKDDQGNYCGMDAREFLVCAGPNLHTMLMEVIGGILVVGGNTSILNANSEEFKLTSQLLPSLSGNKLAVFRKRAAGMGSAMIRQTLIPTEPVVLGLDSEYCKLNGNLLFKVEGTYNVGYGRWQDACQVTLS